MRFGFAEACLDHDPGPRHPESPDRLEAIRQALQPAHGAQFHRPPPADRELVRRVHHESQVAEIEELCRTGGGAIDSDTIVSEGTMDAALASAGIARWVADQADPGVDRRAIPFALCRPPGHHARPDRAMGFCIFNNVAIAAETALEAPGVDRVAILDWDVHHGNGTELVFYDRDEVGFVSIHEDGIYPGTGAIEDTGEGAGEGTTMNVPLAHGADSSAYVAALDDLAIPWFERHEPDLLLISAGFDAHHHDPISRMGCTTECFGSLAARVCDLADRCDAGIGFVLEGGYGLDTLSESIVMINEVCGGYEPVIPDDGLREEDRERIDRVADVHGLGA